MDDILDSLRNKATPRTAAVCVWIEAVALKGSFAFHRLVTFDPQTFILQKHPTPTPSPDPGVLGRFACTSDVLQVRFRSARVCLLCILSAKEF